ncbi:hypothetical protein AMAG_04655 [Allomyces macrogynus ATCC 38327]|uniref:Uncharacterized protein n=1 Tax=Allomyces macrogynus (strain ATCC 38327) TaxID=578462 RepID=A0A0L0S5J5_ALLM3|nr:hypothetical protein AMAG_04655 [Allomyces macrogynus ATCC 38327]|eukprot:KNE57808.1 hypothetical protein AMAG_04655 [Allomyces macrogynus ATCC 38327]
MDNQNLDQIDKTHQPATKVGGVRHKAPHPVHHDAYSATDTAQSSTGAADAPSWPYARADEQSAPVQFATDQPADDLQRDLDRAQHEVSLELKGEERAVKHQQQKTWDQVPTHAAHQAAPPRHNKGELGKTYQLFQPRQGPMF